MKTHHSIVQRFRLAAVLLLGLASSLSAAPGDSGEIKPTVVQKCKAATVLVDLGQQGSGSGFLVHSSGIFVTNRHVIQSVPSGGAVKLVLHSGESNEQVIEARVALISEEDDIALLKTDAALKIAPLSLAAGSELRELSKIVVLGYPFGRMLATGGQKYPSISINTGRVSGLRRDGDTLERIQFDAATNPGNSGGPMIVRTAG